MGLFRLDASIRTEGSHSRAIADIVEAEWRAARPGAEVEYREIGLDPVPATAWARAVSGSRTPADARTAEQAEAVALAAAETDRLVSAEALLFAVPLYNWGVDQHFKTWVDLLITDPRIGGGAAEQTLGGKPAVLVMVRGGSYAPGTPKDGWDHATGWMHRILADLWHLDLRVIETDLTLAEVNPVMAPLIDLAKQKRREAEDAAREHGRAFHPLPVA
jgi:FMN-dependent NADH-azoreductase